MILEKDIKDTIEYYLFNVDEEHEQLQLASEDIIFGVKTGIADGGRSNAIRSQTEASAIKLIDQKLDETEKWLEVIEYTIERFKGTEYEGVINLTYKHQYRLPKILRLLSLEKSAYYEKRNDIIMFAALKATEKGLLNF